MTLFISRRDFYTIYYYGRLRVIVLDGHEDEPCTKWTTALDDSFNRVLWESY